MASQQSQEEYTSPLLEVPLEVLSNIASSLTTSEYGSLRLVCRQLDASLFHSFAHEFFTKKAFVLTEFSLEALVDISHSRFAPSLKYLIINLERPTTMHWLGSQSTVAHEEYYDHKTLINSGRDVELIIEALRNFKNLETFGLRDFSSRGRDRDGRYGGNPVWQPYGSKTFADRTGTILSMPTFNFNNERQTSANVNYVSRTFLACLRALGQANMTRPPRFEVILRHCHVPDLAFNLPRYLQPTILPVLQNLKVLFLDLGRLTFNLSHMVQNGASKESYPGFLVTVFLSKLRSLEHLRLNFKDCPDDAPVPLFKWLAQPPPAPPDMSQIWAPAASQAVGSGSNSQTSLPSLPQPPSLPYLKQLDIGWVTTETIQLLGLLRRFRSSLRNISLHKVTLQQNGGAERGVRNLWAKFLSQTTKLGINISSIELTNIKQSHRHSVYEVEFRDPHRLSVATNIRTKAWAGSDWELGSRDLIESVFVKYPDDTTEDGYEDEGMTDLYFSDEDGFSEMDQDEFEYDDESLVDDEGI